MLNSLNGRIDDFFSTHYEERKDFRWPYEDLSKSELVCYSKKNICYRYMPKLWKNSGTEYRVVFSQNIQFFLSFYWKKNNFIQNKKLVNNWNYISVKRLNFVKKLVSSSVKLFLKSKWKERNIFEKHYRFFFFKNFFIKR